MFLPLKVFVINSRREFLLNFLMSSADLGQKNASVEMKHLDDKKIGDIPKASE